MAVQNAAAEINTIQVTGTGKGTVDGPGTFACVKAGDAPQSCAQLYITPASPKTYTATPATGSYFFGWSGACTGTGACVLNGDLTATATFKTSILFDPSLILELPPLLGYKVEVQGGGTGDGFVTGPPLPKSPDPAAVTPKTPRGRGRAEGAPLVLATIRARRTPLSAAFVCRDEDLERETG